MSEAKNNSRSKQVGPTVPKGHVLGEFTNYQGATAMVDRLLQGDFKATDVSIVGHDPVLVERIRSRLGYGRVAASGALTGFCSPPRATAVHIMSSLAMPSNLSRLSSAS